MKNSLKFGLALWCILTVAAALLTYVYFTMPKKNEELGLAAGIATLGWCFISAVMMFAFSDDEETKEVPSATDEE